MKNDIIVFVVIVVFVLLFNMIYFCIRYYYDEQTTMKRRQVYFPLMMKRIYDVAVRGKIPHKFINMNRGLLTTIVCSVPNKHARVMHMQRLLYEQNIEFSFTWELGAFIDKNTPLVEYGIHQKYIHDWAVDEPVYPAHCFSYLISLYLFLKSKATFVLMLEDDVIMSVSKSMKEFINEAPFFDVLMLEYCHPTSCHKLNGNAYVANLDGVCSGAIVWSRNGVEKFLEFVEHKKFLRTIDLLILDFFKTRNCTVMYTYPRAMRQDRETFTDMTTQNDMPECPEKISPWTRFFKNL